MATIDYHVLDAPSMEVPSLYGSLAGQLGRNAVGYQMEPWHDVPVEVVNDYLRRREQQSDSGRPFLELPLYDIVSDRRAEEEVEEARVIVIDL
ncbi:hypothetical protein CL620_01630 [archaeon]|nr:hypothetical protein [archaeon]